jgi:hypothetical protein
MTNPSPTQPLPYPPGYPPAYPQGAPLPHRTPNAVVAGSLRVLGLVVMLGLLGAGAGAVVVEFFRQTAVETVPLATGLTQVFATTDTGDVRVRAADLGEQPRMIRTLRWSFGRPLVQQAVSAGTERVDARCPRQWFMSNCSVDLELVVPAATTMQVATDTGRVSVSGTSSGVTAITTTGGVTLSGVTGGNVSARTNTGDVTVLATAPDGVVSASTDTGDVRLSFTSPPRSVRASTSTGDVTISVPAGDAYAVNSRTDVGESTVLVPNDPAAARSISATTSVGDIQVASGR